jgi:nucleotide-binding universal stress UspA family protein
MQMVPLFPSPEENSMAPALILHPSDSSPASDTALAVALGLAAEYHARLLVLGSVPPFSWSNRVTYGNQPLEPETSLQQVEHELRDRVRDKGEVEYLTLVDDLVPAVLRTAKERKCDLIVMGQPEAGGWWGRLFRSPPEQVATSAPCPVLLVRADAIRAFPRLGRVA